jgi:hypothetical protein
MILGGDPQSAYHGLLIAALYAVVLSYAKCEEFERSDDSWASSLVIRLGLTVIAAAIALVLAAVQILPSAEAMRHSERAAFNRPRNLYESIATLTRPAAEQRGESRGESIVRGLFCQPEEGSHHDMAYEFSVGPWRLVEYAWPNVGGRMFPTQRRWFSLIPAELATWTPTLYLGLLPLMLALFAFRLRGGEGRARWMSWLALTFTLGSFGYYGLGWLRAEFYGTVLGQDASKVEFAPAVGGVYWLFATLLPSYVYFRYPAKLLPLVSLGLSQLAAMGFDRVFAGRRPRLAQALLVLGCFSGMAAIVVWCLGPAMFASAARPDSTMGRAGRALVACSRVEQASEGAVVAGGGCAADRGRGRRCERMAGDYCAGRFVAPGIADCSSDSCAGPARSRTAAAAGLSQLGTLESAQLCSDDVVRPHSRIVRVGARDAVSQA